MTDDCNPNKPSATSVAMGMAGIIIQLISFIAGYFKLKSFKGESDYMGLHSIGVLFFTGLVIGVSGLLFGSIAIGIYWKQKKHGLARPSDITFGIATLVIGALAISPYVVLPFL